VPRLNPASRREFIQKLKAEGFEGPFPGGKHQWMRRAILRSQSPIRIAVQLIPDSFGESSTN
jgi:hypothetical protein